MTHGALALATPASEPVPEPPPYTPSADELTPTPPPTSTVALTAAKDGEKASAEPLVVFRAILRRIAETRPALASVFEHASVRELTSQRVVLGFEAQSFAGTQAQAPEALDVVTQAVRAHFGVPTEVTLDLSARTRPGETVAIHAAASRREASDKARAVGAAHPLVVEALRLFGGELREVRLREEEE
jgi:hypothetical protein